MRNISLAIVAAASLAAFAHQPVETTTPPPVASQPPVVAPHVPRPGSIEDFRVSVGDRIFFGYDRYDLTPEARSVLERQAAWLRQYPSVRVLVEGNADERGTR